MNSDFDFTKGASADGFTDRVVFEIEFGRSFHL